MRQFKPALLYLVVLFFASSFSFAQFSYQATILKVSGHAPRPKGRGLPLGEPLRD